MDAWGAWMTLAAVLLLAELLTGTFYLLVMALATGSAGLSAIMGGPVALQVALAAAIGVAGCLLLRRTSRGHRHRHGASEQLQHLDVGQHVYVEAWSADRTTRVQYRGALWDAELSDGAPAVTGDCVIRDVRISRLVVTPIAPS